MEKARSCLHFPSSAASHRALTWEGAAEAMPAKMTTCCLWKVSLFPYKVILKGKYQQLRRLEKVYFQTCNNLLVNNVQLLLGFVLLESVPTLCATWGCGRAVQCAGRLAGSQADTHLSFTTWYTASCVHGLPHTPKHQDTAHSS